MKDRAVKILDILANNRKMTVTMLAEMLAVSQLTLRKDLVNLEKYGIVGRSHGFVSLDDANKIGKRIAFSYLIKKRIARAAVQTIEENETVMIESGSCCALFAEELALSGRNVTIITNSIFNVNFLHNLPKAKIILLGGCFLPESQAVIGSMTIANARNFYIDKFFLGANGFIPEHGFTGGDYLCAETSVGLAKDANKVYVLTEAAKFKCYGAYVKTKYDKLTGVFTDDSIPTDAEAVLIKNNVQLFKVPVIEEKIIWRQFPGLPPILYTEKAES